MLYLKTLDNFSLLYPLLLLLGINNKNNMQDKLVKIDNNDCYFWNRLFPLLLLLLLLILIDAMQEKR